MGEPRRIQLSRKKGWRMPENTVKVSRPSLFGNPFVDANGKVYAAPASIHFEVHVANSAAEAYRLWLTGKMIQAEADPFYRTRREAVVAALPSLSGKNLACWCGEGPCHADVLLELSNRPVCEEVGNG